MGIFANNTRRMLEAGRVVLGLGVRQARSVEIGMIARAAGFDFLFIDREHGPMGMDTAAELCVAALGQGVTPIVRVAGPEPHHYIALLDSGAQGVCVPHVDTAEQARAIVANAKYPPIGHRSISRTSPLSGYESLPIEQFTREGNAETLVIAMLESPEAIAQADAIAAVEHVDVLLIGTSDLCNELGIPGEFGHERIVQAYETVVAACRRHGKHAGMSGVREDALMRRYIEMGARFVVAGTDVPLLIEAGKGRTRLLRDIESGLGKKE
ncbi:MAG TPA: aldolase/citrate lyase family protein [Ramlibacter sp.]|nr:aldolase/citrate lyase family protein [Ramlibacter sp.]